MSDHPEEGSPLGGGSIRGPEASSTTTSGGSTPQAKAPLRPPWPLAKRLNRNALTVAAALAGVTVLTVVVVTNPSSSTAGAGNGPATSAGEASAPIPAHPAFLDQPPRMPPAVTPRLDTVSGAAAANAWGIAAGAKRGPAGLVGGGSASVLPVPPAIPDAVGAGGGMDSATQSGVYGAALPPYGAGGASAAPPPSPRQQAYQAALTSSVLVGTAAGAGEAGRGSVQAANALLQHESRDSAEAAERGVVAAPGDVAYSARFGSAGSPYTVRAGTLIPGLLLTGVNSDLPGEVLGQTSRDVFDSRTEHVLLIPKGSRLIGTYDNRSVGTGRLVVSWVRLILPDGRGLTLPKVAATDERGQAGLHDEVDHHFGRVYGAAVLTSVLTAGVQLSQPQQAGLYSAPSARQVAAGALGQNVGASRSRRHVGDSTCRRRS